MIQDDLWQRARTLAERCYSVEAHESQLLDRSIVVVCREPRFAGLYVSWGHARGSAGRIEGSPAVIPVHAARRWRRLCRSPEPTTSDRPQVTWLEPDLIDESLWARAETLAAREYMVEFSPETLEDGSEGVLAENPEMPGCMENRTHTDRSTGSARPGSVTSLSTRCWRRASRYRHRATCKRWLEKMPPESPAER